MDPDFLDSFEAIFTAYRDQEKIIKIINESRTLRKKEGDCLDFLLGSFYGASTYLYESFASNVRKEEEEFNRLVAEHIKELCTLFNKVSSTPNYHKIMDKNKF